MIEKINEEMKKKRLPFLRVLNSTFKDIKSEEDFMWYSQKIYKEYLSFIEKIKLENKYIGKINKNYFETLEEEISKIQNSKEFIVNILWLNFNIYANIYAILIILKSTVVDIELENYFYGSSFDEMKSEGYSIAEIVDIISNKSPYDAELVLYLNGRDKLQQDFIYNACNDDLFILGVISDYNISTESIKEIEDHISGYFFSYDVEEEISDYHSLFLKKIKMLGFSYEI